MKVSTLFIESAFILFFKFFKLLGMSFDAACVFTIFIDFAQLNLMVSSTVFFVLEET